MRKLPVRMHFKHGRYYYVHRNKWHPLSKNYQDALIEYSRLIAPEVGGLDRLVNRVMEDIRDTLAPNTYKNYRLYGEVVKRTFVEFSPEQVKPKHIAALLDHYQTQPSKANALRNVLKVIFNKAVRWGITDINPVQFIPPFKVSKRDRYVTEAEFAAIRDKASPTLKAIMDICYLTGQRIGDVLKIAYADIDEVGIFFKQQKTGNRLRIAMTADLAAAVANARALHRSVKGLTLFHTRQGKPFSYSTIRTLWDRARKAAGVEDVHIHDIRAKAATDAKAQGLDSKTLLGHSSEAAHQRYLRGKEIPVAEPVKIKKT